MYHDIRHLHSLPESLDTCTELFQKYRRRLLCREYLLHEHEHKLLKIVAVISI